jgi:hypothetical protein
MPRPGRGLGVPRRDLEDAEEPMRLRCPKCEGTIDVHPGAGPWTIYACSNPATRHEWSYDSATGLLVTPRMR